MILWHVTSYRDGLRLEYEHLLAVSRLQQQYGRWLWRWRAPLDLRLALRLAPAKTATRTGKEPTTMTEPAMTERDQRLVTAAAGLIRDAGQQGTTLSQAELGRRLRVRGLSIPNGRLRWLAATAKARPPEIQAD
jgi:hypothetical protein